MTSGFGDLIQVFDQLLAVERHKLLERVRLDISEAHFEANRRGMGQSSVAVNAITRTAATSMAPFSQAAFNLSVRCAVSHGIAINDETREEFSELLRSRMDQFAATLAAVVRDNPVLKNPSFAGVAKAGITRIHDAADLELKRLDGELRLIAAAAKRSDVSGSGSSFVFQGPVGVVQTGPGSVGTANQIIDGAAREYLEKALSELAALMDTKDVGTEINVTEVRELVVDAQTELAKPSPNQAKLKSLVSGIGSTISYLPTLKSAYDTLKWAGTFLGLTLP